ncbi:hypothetical protein GCM10027061_21230 [Nesterenkonia suensis]
MHYDPDHCGRWIEVAPDTWFPDTLLVAGTVEGCEVSAWYALDVSRLRYSIFALQLRAEPDCDEIDAAMLRRLSLTGFLDMAWTIARSSAGVPQGDLWPGGLSAPDAAYHPTLVEAARIYAREALSGHRPAKGVREQMGVSASTAGYWIRRAKDRGFLIVEGDESIDKETE